jgi:hypothetical protein
MPDLVTDDRALAWNFMVYGATLVVGALLYIALDTPFTEFHSRAVNQSNTTYSNASLDWVMQAWNAAPILILALGFVMIVASALFESTTGGPFS